MARNRGDIRGNCGICCCCCCCCLDLLSITSCNFRDSLTDGAVASLALAPVCASSSVLPVELSLKRGRFLFVAVVAVATVVFATTLGTSTLDLGERTNESNARAAAAGVAATASSKSEA